jgi:uncharacterized protein with beta-barrel porin domain
LLGNGYTLSGTDASNYKLNMTANISPLDSVAWTGSATGDWSNAANWAGGIIPEGSGNVLAVTIPSDVTVTFDSGVATTTINTLTSLGNLTMAAGNLFTTGNLSTVAYQQTGGTLSVGGEMNVTQSFNKGQGATGSLLLNGVNSVLNIHQATGDLVFYNDKTIQLGGTLSPYVRVVVVFN